MANHTDAEIIQDGEDLVNTNTGEIIPETPATAIVPYQGMSVAPFEPRACEVLLREVKDDEVEIRPDGLIYLPGIEYRRRLNEAFSPGAWSVMPLDITIGNGDNMMYYRGALFAHGRFVSEAIGEQQYYESNDRMSYATAAESAKSNCLMRCCKDIGIASELWDPKFTKRWLAAYAVEVWCENQKDHKKKKLWRKRTDPKIDQYPWKESGGADTEYGGGIGSRPADRPKEQAPAQTAPPAQKPVTINPEQAKKFVQIALEMGWDGAEVKSLLKVNGYARSADIKPADYDRLCKELQDPTLLAEIRQPNPSAPAPKPEGLAGAKRDTDLTKFGEPTDSTKYPGGCTHKQLKRLHTIATEKGWDREWVKWLIQSYGKNSSKDLTTELYDKVVADLESPMMLEEYRNRNPKPVEDPEEAKAA